MQLYQLNLKIHVKTKRVEYERYAIQYQAIDDNEAIIAAKEKIASYQKDNEGKLIEPELFMVGKKVNLESN
jgi:hypothetical protein